LYRFPTQHQHAIAWLKDGIAGHAGDHWAVIDVRAKRAAVLGLPGRLERFHQLFGLAAETLSVLAEGIRWRCDGGENESS
jgi:hypothetical protein